MELVKIICDKCGYSVEKDLSGMSAKRLKASCPKCRNAITIDRSPDFQGISEESSTGAPGTPMRVNCG